MAPTQARVRADVLDELAWDDRVLATDVRVDVLDGTVTLSGRVPTHFSRQAAIDAAGRVPGVREVVDQLSVLYPGASEGPSDERICTHIENVLDWNPDIDILGVVVSVDGGVVTLRGTVDALWKKSLAEDLVLALRGVMAVENELVIVPADISDQTIADDIICTLERRDSLDPNLIDVHVREGLVTLSGTVPTVEAEEIAFDAARYTAGVRGVRNDMTIVP